MLENINSPADLKALSYSELDTLCGEIREFLIDTISQTGGHLASNLGTVELSIALNRVYDASKDRILFDVGHQCYTHKILNGRREEFHTLRQFGGTTGDAHDEHAHICHVLFNHFLPGLRQIFFIHWLTSLELNPLCDNYSSY